VPSARRPDGVVLARCVVWTALVGTSLGALAGLAEGIAVYPVSSWAPVTLYVALLAAILSALLGLLAGCAAILARRCR
jgi:hypothetical protein